MNATVNIVFAGDFSARTGKRSESLEVPENIREAYESIQDYLKTKYRISPPYIMLFGKRHIMGVLKKDGNMPVKNGDSFEIMPSISGG